MKIMKKIMIAVAMLAMVLTGLTVTALAEENSARININNEPSLSFDELVIVENGKTYIPLRLAFPNLNDKQAKLGMKLVWGTQYPVVRLIYGATTGESQIVEADGTTTPPYNGKRRCIDVMWEGNAHEGVKAYLSIVDYTYVVDGMPGAPETNDEYTLDDPLYLKTLNDGGDRVFISLDDASKLSKLLGVDENYSVKLYK